MSEIKTIDDLIKHFQDGENLALYAGLIARAADYEYVRLAALNVKRNLEADHIVEANKKVDDHYRWRKVGAGGFPGYGLQVICMDVYRRYFIAIYYDGKFHQHPKGFTLRSITHWRYLDKPND